MIKFLKKNWILLVILILAALLRLYRLGEVPPSLTWDETALGYNAYSILRTGKDEYGQFLPLIFKSFGDYKPGLYVYLEAPFVWLLGLTELAVRLPSAILGSLGVLGMYLLAKELFVNSSTLQDAIPACAGRRQPPRFLFGPHSDTLRVSSGHLSLITSFLLAISPWHINLSRGAWEANVTLFFVLLGVVMFLRFLKEPRSFKFLVFGFWFLVLSLYTYQGAKLFVPLLVSGMILIYSREILKIDKKKLLLACLPFLLVIPLYFGLIGESGGRLRVMSVFSFPRPESDIQELLAQDKTTQSSLTFKLFHSEGLNFVRGILGRYFNHFSGRFLSFEGDWQNRRLGVPYMGMLYFIDLVFALLGLAVLVGGKERSKYLILWWLLVAPIPAALSRDAVSSVRTLPMVVPLTILTGSGILGVLGYLGSKRKKTLAVLLLILVYSWHLVYYFDQYYIHQGIRYSQTMQFGYKEVVNYIYQNSSEKYEKIIFTESYGQPYIYWLFYNRYNPGGYQKQANLTESPVGDVGRVERIDNVEFRNIYWPNDRELKNSLFVGTEWELPLKDIDPRQAEVLEEIRFLNGQLAFRIVKTK